MTHSNKKIAALVFDRLTFFELGIAVEVFGLPRPEIRPWYDFAVCSAEAGSLRTLGGMEVTTSKGLRALSSADTILVPGWRDVNERPPEAALRALQRANERGARLISFCSGAFVLAAAGILDGRRATTHWRYADAMAERYPAVTVDPNVLYVEDGNVLTAAGSAAGIDLSLHVVRSDYGAEVANLVARRLVVPPHRDGGQAQFIDRPLAECDDDALTELMDWLSGNLSESHTVESMAKRAFMSPRTFARQFRSRTGTTPARWLIQRRVHESQRLLETSEAAIDEIALRCGFSSAQLLRHHFTETTGLTPTAYRRTYRAV
ncbi:MAG: helix-turn-helix domain-containing protein [Aureliella sp.]